MEEKERRTIQVTARIDRKSYEWIQEKIQEKKFRNIAHAIDWALEKVREKDRIYGE